MNLDFVIEFILQLMIRVIKFDHDHVEFSYHCSQY